MAKEVVNKIRIQIPAGKATPAPPVGTALGPVGINLGEFCTKFNDATKDMMGDLVSAVIKVYDDRSFDFEIKSSPASFLLKKTAKIQKGSATGAKDIVATVSEKQIREIAELKMKDLNAYDIDAAMKIIEGTAHNMGIVLESEKAEFEEHFAAQKAEEERIRRLEEQEAIEAEQAALEQVTSSTEEQAEEDSKEE